MKSKVSNYRQFDVYRVAYAASLSIHKLTYDFPKLEQYNGLADQMRRASKSICANIAEGYGRSFQSPKDFGRFVLMALGSSDEMQVWLDYARDLKFMIESDAAKLQNEYQTISKMLVNLQRTSSTFKQKAA